AEVVQATSLARPTVHRIVHVLIEEGIVERSERTGNYVVGRQVPELALARPSRSPLMVAAEPHLAEASAQLGDTLFLTVRTGLDTLCVARRIGSYPIQVLSIEVGVRRPLGVSSAGVAILAAMPALEARKIVLANETRFGAYRTDTATVLGQIQLARRRGYNLRDVGLVQGTKSLSAWIRTPDGQRAHDALSHAGGARIDLGVETDAVVRNRDHEVFALWLELDVNRSGAVGIGVFDGVHHQLVDDDADRHRAVRVDLDRFCLER